MDLSENALVSNQPGISNGPSWYLADTSTLPLKNYVPIAVHNLLSHWIITVTIRSFIKGFLPIHLSKWLFFFSNTYMHLFMVYTFLCAPYSHLEMQLNDIILVSFMISDTFTLTDTDLMPPKMADININIWYRCIPNTHARTHARTHTQILL